MHIAIVGATGAVGKTLLQLLEQRNNNIDTLSLFASPRSKGKSLTFKGSSLTVDTLTNLSFEGIDLVFFAAGKKVSLEHIPYALKAGVRVIDLSSAYRQDPKVPLVIPEINGAILKGNPSLIASPNCSTTIMLMVLAPLHFHFSIKRILATTYQAASGAGEAAMQELLEESKAFLANTPFARKILPHPYAFNLFTHNAAMTSSLYNEEEIKMVEETHKILKDPSIKLSATCVRVPVLRAHSESLNVEFNTPVTRKAIYEVLASSPGISLLEDWEANRFAMPLDASNKEEIFYGRIREDTTQAHTFWFWVVGDQLLKGAALNAVQIAEMLYWNKLLR